MAIKLYGGAHGRASRSLIALEELGLAYEHVPLKPWDKPEHRETLLRLNPNAKVPTLDDDGFILWESMAINFYLGDKVGGPLWPSDPADRGRMYQWSVWAQTAIDVPARHAARIGADPAAKAAAETERLDVLGILDRALNARRWLAGADFTLADLNAAATLSEPWENSLVDGNLDPADYGLANLADWLNRCTGRESWRRVRALP